MADSSAHQVRLRQWLGDLSRRHGFGQDRAPDPVADQIDEDAGPADEPKVEEGSDRWSGHAERERPWGGRVPEWEGKDRPGFPGRSDRPGR